MEIFTVTLREEIVHRLVAEFHPEAIYIFGSHAWGEPDPDCDLELMVIVSDSQQSTLERAQRAYNSLRGVLTPVDVVVKTHAEFKKFRRVYASLEAQVYEKGELIYGCKE